MKESWRVGHSRGIGDAELFSEADARNTSYSNGALPANATPVRGNLAVFIGIIVSISAAQAGVEEAFSFCASGSQVQPYQEFVPEWMRADPAVPFATLLSLSVGNSPAGGIFSQGPSAAPQKENAAPKPVAVSKPTLLDPSPYEGRSVFYTGNDDAVPKIDGIMTLVGSH